MAHQHVLFSLSPKNDRAEEIVKHADNSRFRLPKGDSGVSIGIGHVSSKNKIPTTLATIGRGCDVDIVVDDSRVSKIQCSFEINLDTGFVMFYDRSHAQTSQVHGNNCTPFEDGRPRKVVVLPDLNTEIGFGGAKRDLYLFQLVWHQSAEESIETAKIRKNVVLEENPRLAETATETADDTDTMLSRMTQTRAPTRERQMPVRWKRMDTMGSGSYGDVFKAVNIDDGRLVAVKRMKKPRSAAERQFMKAKWVLEAKMLKNMRHPHIVEYISCQDRDGGIIELIMPIRSGTLKSLIESVRPIQKERVGHIACHHILQAIDFLSSHRIVHRDVKPDNILYAMRSEEYYFQLCDFGLSSHELHATGVAGTPLYMAPELLARREQTHKADVWSLFVTVLYTMGGDASRNYFRTRPDEREIHSSIVRMALEDNSVKHLQEMARIDPDIRASAAQMLVKCHEGKGLTTPRNKIPPLLYPRPVTEMNPLSPIIKVSNAPDIPKFQPLEARFYNPAPPKTPVAPKNQALTPKFIESLFPPRDPVVVIREDPVTPDAPNATQGSACPPPPEPRKRRSILHRSTSPSRVSKAQARSKSTNAGSKRPSRLPRQKASNNAPKYPDCPGPLFR